VEIEFDPVKDQINLLKHGVSLAAAADMDLERLRAIGSRMANPRERQRYGQSG
jgi:uncharacterized DUF497 family protein